MSFIAQDGKVSFECRRPYKPTRHLSLRRSRHFVGAPQIPTSCFRLVVQKSVLAVRIHLPPAGQRWQRRAVAVTRLRSHQKRRSHGGIRAVTDARMLRRTAALPLPAERHGKQRGRSTCAQKAFRRHARRSNVCRITYKSRGPCFQVGRKGPKPGKNEFPPEFGELS
jgi:hypothetical protein